MIASLHGTVSAVTLNFAILEVGGIGYRVYSTAAVLSQLQAGSEILLHTHLVVREDSLTLYGFSDAQTCNAFEILLGIPKVGPKVALAMLSVYGVPELRAIVAEKNHAALQKVPGIGAKGAQRIILDIGTKLGEPTPGAGLSISEGDPVAKETVMQALQSLGFTMAQARSAVNAIVSLEPAIRAEDLLKESLKALRN